MSAPAWMVPEGISEVRRNQVEKDWRDRDRRKPASNGWAGFEAALNRYFDAEIAVLEAARDRALLENSHD